MITQKERRNNLLNIFLSGLMYKNVFVLKTTQITRHTFCRKVFIDTTVMTSSILTQKISTITTRSSNIPFKYVNKKWHIIVAQGTSLNHNRTVGLQNKRHFFQLERSNLIHLDGSPDN
jgi:hypothetical protein